MIVVQVGVRELEGGPPTVVLSCSEEEAVAMASKLFERVELQAPASECHWDGCGEPGVVCLDHHQTLVREGKQPISDSLREYAQTLVTFTRAARLLLGSLAAERNANNPAPLMVVTDSRTRALADLLGDA